MREGRTGVDAGDELGLREVADVENDKSVVPIAHVQPIAVAQRMMAAGRNPIGPGIVFATRLPLPGDPPASDLLGLGGIGEVEDHDDIADEAFDRRRDVGVAPVEVEAVNAAAGCAPLRDQLRLARTRDIIDVEPAADVRGTALSELLVIHQHDAVVDADLVGMPPIRDVDLREHARLAWVSDVDDGRAAGRPLVTDIKRGAFDPHLPAPRAIQVRQQGRVALNRHGSARAWLCADHVIPRMSPRTFPRKFHRRGRSRVPLRSTRATTTTPRDGQSDRRDPSAPAPNPYSAPAPSPATAR